jgi:hypothetical protein
VIVERTERKRWLICEIRIGIFTDDLMFLLVENLRWKDLAGSVSPSLSEESSPTAETGFVEMVVSFAAIRLKRW